MSDENPTGIINEEPHAGLIGDTSDPEYIVRYNLFNASEPIGGFTLNTGHANITLIERNGTDDTVIGPGNFGVNASGGDHYSFANPFDDKLDGIMGVDTSDWQGAGQAIYEQTITPEQMQNVIDSITSSTGTFGDTIKVNYNVGASVLDLKDQHSCYTFVEDIYETTGGKGRLLDQFSESELEKVDSLIETVHGDIPKIPEKVKGKISDAANDAADAITNTAESGIEKVRNGLGIGSEDEAETDHGALTVPTNTPFGIPIETAIETLAADQQAIESAYQGGERSPVHEALSHPSALQMYSNLYENGVETVPAEITPDMSPEDRAGELLLAGRTATHEAGLELPEVKEVTNDNETSQTIQSHDNPYEEEYAHTF